LKFGIIGLPGSGKTTVLRALSGTGEAAERTGHLEPGLAAVKVEDERLDFLADLFKPKKVTPVDIEYLDVAGLTGEDEPGREIGDRILGFLRPVDALIICVRFFDSPVLGPPDPVKDTAAVEEQMILSDLAIVEKRIERVERDIARGRKELTEEFSMLGKARALLEDGKPLRIRSEMVDSPLLKGFAFLSAKPALLLLNVGDDKSSNEVEAVKALISAPEARPNTAVDWLYADAEAEIARLDPDDAREFLEDLGLEEGAKRRTVRTSFDLLSLVVFFTVGRDEVRAWPVRTGSTAPTAAGTVHSDMQKGFIRAEVIGYDDFKTLGSMAEAKKAGKLRLEGKEYRVRDGDIIQFLFNV
jgi:GTP-binding protein YchF